MDHTPPPAIRTALKSDDTSPNNLPHIKLADAPPPTVNSASTFSPTSPNIPGILSTTHTPRTSVSGPPGSSGWSSTAGFPRTHTGSTSIEGGRYRRKVAFETFDDLPDTLFTFTAQVSRRHHGPHSGPAGSGSQKKTRVATTGPDGEGWPRMLE